jgi:cytochrome c5
MKITRYIIYVSLLIGINLFFTGNAFCKDYSKGKTIFRNNCTACHLIKSEGAPVSAYHAQYNPEDFTTVSAWKHLSEEKINFVLTRGQGVMKPIQLSAEDYRALIDYMMNDLKKQSESSSTK